MLIRYGFYLAVFLITLSKNFIQGTPDYIYLYVTERRSWNEALQICERFGGTLARITSQEVEDTVFANFASGGVWEGHPQYEFWIGLTVTVSDGGNELIFYWSDCTELDTIATTFLNIEGENHRKHIEYCITISTEYRQLKYKDCKGDAPFLCEVPRKAGCHFTEEVGYYLSGPASIDYCAELCLQSAECIGTVLVDSDCFLLSENQTMASGYGIPASASGSYTVRRKECISAQLITNPDDSGVINNGDRVPWLYCFGTRESLSASSSTTFPTLPVPKSTTSKSSTILPSATVETSPILQTTPVEISTTFPSMTIKCSTIFPSTIVHFPTILPLCTTAPTAPSSTILPLSTTLTTEIFPSTTVLPPVTFDINDLSRIFINDVEIRNATCILETVYIPKVTPCFQEAISTVFIGNNPGMIGNITDCPTFPDIEYHVICNTTRAKLEDLAAETEEIIRQLTVKPETTAAYMNKFKCAEDSRTSAKAVGSSLGIVFIVLPALLVIISDFPRFYHLIWKVYKSIKKKRTQKFRILSNQRNINVQKTFLPSKFIGLFSGNVPIYSSDITSVERFQCMEGIKTLPTDLEPVD